MSNVNFKVYKRKIDVYRRANRLDGYGILTGIKWVYAHSTNAYPTCKTALAAAKAKWPNEQLKASFSKIN